MYGCSPEFQKKYRLIKETEGLSTGSKARQQLTAITRHDRLFDFYDTGAPQDSGAISSVTHTHTHTP